MENHFAQTFIQERQSHNPVEYSKSGFFKKELKAPKLSSRELIKQSLICVIINKDDPNLEITSNMLGNDEILDKIVNLFIFNCLIKIFSVFYARSG